MSGAYVFQSSDSGVDMHEIARLLSAQLVWRNETVNHVSRISTNTQLRAKCESCPGCIRQMDPDT